MGRGAGGRSCIAAHPPGAHPPSVCVEASPMHSCVHNPALPPASLSKCHRHFECETGRGVAGVEGRSLDRSPCHRPRAAPTRAAPSQHQLSTRYRLFTHHPSTRGRSPCSAADSSLRAPCWIPCPRTLRSQTPPRHSASAPCPPLDTSPSLAPRIWWVGLAGDASTKGPKLLRKNAQNGASRNYVPPGREPARSPPTNLPPTPLAFSLSLQTLTGWGGMVMVMGTSAIGRIAGVGFTRMGKTQVRKSAVGWLLGGVRGAGVSVLLFPTFILIKFAIPSHRSFSGHGALSPSLPPFE